MHPPEGREIPVFIQKLTFVITMQYQEEAGLFLTLFFTVQPCGSCSVEWKAARFDPLCLKKGQPAELLHYQAK